jgi:hypothetical protein
MEFVTAEANSEEIIVVERLFANLKTLLITIGIASM